MDFYLNQGSKLARCARLSHQWRCGIKRVVRDTDLEGSRMSDRRTSCPGQNCGICSKPGVEEVWLDTKPLVGGSRPFKMVSDLASALLTCQGCENQAAHSWSSRTIIRKRENIHSTPNQSSSVTPLSRRQLRNALSRLERLAI